MDERVLASMRAELEKVALLERLVRLGATDVPGTPRLFMRQRAPGELAALQQGVDNWWGKKVTAPLMNVANKGLTRLPEGRVRNIAGGLAKRVAEDPVVLATELSPVPGSSIAYLAGKKGLEKLIDKVAPIT